MASSNLILIGMPGAGKSTVGRLLAERLQRPFLDTDALIEASHGLRLPELIAQRGLGGFRQAEEAVLVGLSAQEAVIATGGSVVYSEVGMATLRRLGVVVFLHCPLAVLAARVGDPAARGMVIEPDQSFEALYRQRLPLYRRYADVEIDCGDEPPATVAERVLAAVNAGRCADRP
jgi:shikimate kinase